MARFRTVSWVSLYALTAIYGCGSDSGGKQARDAGDMDASQVPSATVEISGRVLDAERKSGVDDAELVAASGEAARSGAGGEFKLVARADDAELEAERKSYASTVRKLPPGGGSLDVFLKSLDETVQFRGDEGVTVRLSSGESLEIPENAVLDDKGARIKDLVTLELAAVDGAEPTQAAALPGDGNAELKNGKKGQASIDAALSITIRNAEGKELTVDKAADVIAEVPARRKDADGELTVYSYDRSARRWKEESKAKRTTNKEGVDVYRGDIDHLSWWSFGRFFATDTCVRVCVEDAAGQPRSGSQVWIVGKSQPGVTSVFTSSMGCASTNTIANAEVVLVAQSGVLTSTPTTASIGNARASIEDDAAACQDLGILTFGQGTNESCALCTIDAPSSDMDAGIPMDAATPSDGATNEGGMADAGDLIDAGTPTDSGGPDAGSTGLVLSTSASTVTSSPITITATPAAADTASVYFYEGATLLGVDSLPPFEQIVNYTFLDNGQHTYTAESTGPGGDVHADPLVLTVNLPPNGYFVDPVAGIDTQAGSQAAPFKTLQRAASAVSAGQNVYLADGVYDATNQPTFQVNWPANVTVQGLSPTGVVLRGDGTNYQMTFTSAGGLHDVKFESFLQAVQVQGTGTFRMSNVQFDTVNIAMFIKGSVNAFLDGTERQMLLNPVLNGGQLFWIEDQAQVDFTGDLTNLNTTGNPVFLARGAAILYVHDSTFSNIDRRIYTGFDNSILSMRNVTMDDIAWPGQNPLGSESGVLNAGGQNTVSPLNHGIQLDNTAITNCQLTGVIITLYGNLATQGDYRFSDSHIDNNAGYGIRVIGTSPFDPGLDMGMRLSNTTVKGNGGAGLSLTATQLEVFGSEISGNTGDGIQMLDAAAINTINVRSSTFANNVGDGIFFDGSGASTFNLGITINNGSNIFSMVPLNQSSVSLLAPITGYAVGNVWLPDVQGASSSGIFTAPASFSDSAGRNFNIGSDSTLVVYE